MATHQSPAQRKTVKRVMHEFKHGELKAAAGKRKVKNPKQAIAIALHEAGASKYESKKENARNLRRTKDKERRGETGQDAAEGRGRKPATERSASGKRSVGTKRTASSSSGTRSSSAKRSAAAKRTSSAAKSRGRGNGKTRAELYIEAKRRNIAGRSKMSKAQLERALQR